MVVIIKDRLVTALFCGVLFCGFVFSLLLPDKELSFSERRHLTAFPVFTQTQLQNGEYFAQIEKYTVDQFVFRENFRTIKAYSSLYLFKRADFHGIYLADNMAVSMEYPLSEKMVDGFISKVTTLEDKYLQSSDNIFYSVIPDKNYFLAKKTGHLQIDYSKMEQMLATGLSDMQYISIFQSLTAGDFYATDSHWKQENLGKVTEKLGLGLGLDASPFPTKFEINSFSPFYGVYYGQSALPLAPDTIEYLVSDVTQNAVVTHVQDMGDNPPVYDSAKLAGMDSYDVFLSGATPICRLDNPLNTTGSELVIFRDSYASSIAPLLLSGYSSITLVDLRYVSPSLLPEHVNFAGKDILFLYSASLINQSNILRG